MNIFKRIHWWLFTRRKIEKYRNDPVFAMEDILGIKLTAVQKAILRDPGILSVDWDGGKNGAPPCFELTSGRRNHHTEIIEDDFLS